MNLYIDTGKQLTEQSKKIYDQLLSPVPGVRQISIGLFLVQYFFLSRLCKSAAIISLQLFSLRRQVITVATSQNYSYTDPESLAVGYIANKI